MTIGRLLALFDGMAKYLELTNPWGSGGDAETDPKRPASAPQVNTRSVIGATEAGAIDVIGTAASHVTVLSPDQVRPDIADLIDPEYHPLKRPRR